MLSAGGDVFWLSQLRFYGKPGLQGWGVGTGVGLALGAVLPYWVTVVMGAFFRDTIPYLSLLVCLMIATHFIVLPRAPNLPTRAGAGSLPKSGGTYQDEEEEDLNMTHFLIENSPPISSMTNDQRFKSNMRLFVTLAYPLILPLLLCSAGYAITYTGFSRALAATPSFDRYTSYIAAYGLAFQLGNLTGRSSYLFSRISLPGNETLITAMTIGAAAVLLNAIFIVVSSSVIVFLLVFTVGVSVGMVYINTLAATLERTTLSVQETEFSLGAVGVGEPTGLLLGGLVGHLLEKTICGLDTGSGQRWCDTTR